MGRVKVTARVYGPQLFRRSKTFPVEVHRELEDTLQDVADFAQNAFETHAPERSGRLKRGITATRTSAGVSIRIHARDPQTGYDYVGVTRFGHKVRRIRPIHGKTATGKRRFRSGFLRFESRGQIWYRRSVRGYHPKHDWVVPARVETRAFARQRIRRFEDNLAKRW